MEPKTRKTADKIISRVIKLGDKVSRKSTFIKSALMDIEEEHNLNAEQVEQVAFYIEVTLLNDPSRLWTGARAKSTRMTALKSKLHNFRVSLVKEDKHLEIIDGRVILTLEDGSKKWLDDNFKTFLTAKQLKAKKEMLAK